MKRTRSNLSRTPLLCLALLSGFVTLLGTARLQAQILQQTFSENVAGFAISSPSQHWYFTPRSVTPGPVRATLRFESPVDHFIPNVTVRTTLLPEGPQDLPSIVKQGLAELPKAAQVLSQRPIRSHGQAGYEVSFQHQDLKLQFLQWIFVSKKKQFVITCTCKISTYPRFEEDFRRILQSFKILKK